MQAGSADVKPSRPFISAYYYLWYYKPKGSPQDLPLQGKWKEGYARAFLEPPQYPSLGEYVSSDPRVIETHIAWASDHGIDCFIFNWEGMEGHRKFLSENLVHILQGGEDDNSMCEGKTPYSPNDSTNNGWDSISQGWNRNGHKINNLTKMRYSALIESRLIVDEWPPVASNPDVIRSFSDALTYMAENFFNSPLWQRVNNKPVVYLYEMCSWIGDTKDFAHFTQALREAVTSVWDPVCEENFVGVYIIADAVYPHDQDMERLTCFDALSGYQPYPPVASSVANDPKDGWIYRGDGLFRCKPFEEYHRKFKTFSEREGMGFVPTVIPRYNDRGVRGPIDQYALPPASSAPYTDIDEAMKCSLFVNSLDAQVRWIDPKINMLNINSWNEWFEDTSIEPVGFLPGMNVPDYFGQGVNVGMSTSKGHDHRVPDRVVIYGKQGHEWIETPEEIKKNGIDMTQGYEWPCYGFSYLQAIKDYFSGAHPSRTRIRNARSYREGSESV